MAFFDPLTASAKKLSKFFQGVHKANKHSKYKTFELFQVYEPKALLNFSKHKLTKLAP